MPLPNDVPAFPTVLSGTQADTTVTPINLRESLWNASLELQKLARSERGDSAQWRQALNQVRGMLAMLDAKRSTPELSQFGGVLRQRREEAGLTQQELAERCRLSTEWIRAIESGRRRTTAKTLRRLLLVPELRLEAEHLVPAAIPTTAHAHSLNWWVAPNFDAVALLQEFKQRLASAGGRIEQTFAYLDPQSALDWCNIASDPRYTMSCRNPMPLEMVAEQVVDSIGRVPIDLIALGPGDGQQETRLAQALVGFQGESNLRVYLMDISQPLLSKAHRYAKDRLDDIRGVTVIGMQGNFHFLPLYEQIFYSPSKRRRVFTLLGGTLQNLDSEPQFFRDALSGAAAGDMALVDVALAFARPEDPAEVYAKDPVFQNRPSEAIATWLGGPFRRYGGVTQIDFSYRLDTNTPVPGSYSIEHIVRVDGEREFSFWRARRYDPELLIQCLAGLGWERVQYIPFGLSTQRNRPALLLLRKRS